MDINAALDRFLSACADNDHESAVQHAEAIFEWVNKGGFLPKVKRVAGLTLDPPTYSIGR